MDFDGSCPFFCTLWLCLMALGRRSGDICLLWEVFGWTPRYILSRLLPWQNCWRLVFSTVEGNPPIFLSLGSWHHCRFGFLSGGLKSTFVFCLNCWVAQWFFWDFLYPVFSFVLSKRKLPEKGMLHERNLEAVSPSQVLGQRVLLAARDEAALAESFTDLVGVSAMKPIALKSMGKYFNSFTLGGTHHQMLLQPF